MRKISTMVLQRLALGLVTLLLVTLVIFLASELLPGDLAEATLGQSATVESLASLRHELGLDRPAFLRYLEWLSDVLTGDFGKSLASGRPISELLHPQLENTFFLAGYSIVLAIPFAVGLGIVTALRRNSVSDRLLNGLALTAISFPEFFLAYILIRALAQTGIFPSMTQFAPGSGLGQHLYSAFLPALTLTFVVTAHMMRMTRAAIINLLATPYIEMARLKGMRPLRVIVIHALPNALAPIINVVAINIAYLITGVVIVEVVFVYPGLGQLMVDSVSRRDLPVVQAIALIFAATYVLVNLLADVLSILSNPRLFHGK